MTAQELTSETFLDVELVFRKLAYLLAVLLFMVIMTDVCVMTWDILMSSLWYIVLDKADLRKAVFILDVFQQFCCDIFQWKFDE